MFVVSSGFVIAGNVDMYNIIMLTDTMPQNLPDLPMCEIYGIFAKLLLCALALHIIAAFFHPLILRDNLWSNIWCSKKE